MKWLANSLMIISLISCGGGSNNNAGTDDLTDTPEEDNELSFTVFEGESPSLDTALTLTNIQWQQISGPEIFIDNLNASSITATIPWVSDTGLVAEFMISGELDGVAQQVPVSVTILNRYFYKLHVYNNVTGATDLFIDYLATTDDSGVPEEGVIQLTNLAANTGVCGTRVSPTGRYIAYGLDTGESIGFSTICRAVYIVDIATNEIQKLSVLGTDSTDIIAHTRQWSPDELTISYIGDHGEGIEQHYVLDINNETTSYLNYHNNSEGNQWPDTVLFPIVDGSHPYNISEIDDTDTSFPAWSGNSGSLNFYVDDTEEGERYIEQSSIYGDARRLETPQFGWDILAVVDPELVSNSPALECVILNCSVLVPPPTDYIIAWPAISSFRSPQRIGSSTEGHLAFMASIIIDELQYIKVLAVRPPVIAGNTTDLSNRSDVKALAVDDAKWSPTVPHLAFAGASEYRFRYSEEIGFNTPVDEPYPNISDGIVSPEIPGQLYFYQNYQRFHTEAHERLSYPQPTIDDNDVRHLQWSDDGQYIAYARGEEDVAEGAYYTSLWVTAIDAERDESEATIDSNTQLLINLRTSNEYFTEYRWAPDGRGLLVVVQTNEGTVLRFISADGSTTSEFTIADDNFDNFYEISLAFSPDGEYFAYETSELINGSFIPTLYIQSTSSIPPVQVNAGFSAGASIRKFQWAPAGQILAYFARTASGQERQLYLSNTNGESQSWETFLSPDQRVVEFSVDHDAALLINIF